MCFMDADTQRIHSLFSLAESGRAKQTANFVSSFAPTLLQTHQFLFLMFLLLPIQQTSLINWLPLHCISGRKSLPAQTQRSAWAETVQFSASKHLSQSSPEHISSAPLKLENLQSWHTSSHKTNWRCQFTAQDRRRFHHAVAWTRRRALVELPSAGTSPPQRPLIVN
jgi:hypothetical protein